MLLRTRVTLLLLVAIGVVVAVMAGTGLQRERLLRERNAVVAAEWQSALWRALIDGQTTLLSSAAQEIARHDGFLRNAIAGNRAEAGALLLAAGFLGGESESVDVIELIGVDRTPLFESRDVDDGRPVLDAANLDRVFAGETANGLRQDAAASFVVLHARWIPLPDGKTATLIVGSAANRLVQRFAEAAKTDAALVSVRGRLAEATDPAEYALVADKVRPRETTVEEARIGERSLTVISVPVLDIAGGAAASLVSITDATQATRGVERLTSWAVAAALGFVALVVLALNVYLWRSFRPLDTAIGVLQGLARGDTSQTLDTTGSDEIGRIGEAVRAFRREALALAGIRAQRERTRLRRERIIRRAITGLANALDQADRTEVLTALAGGGDQPAGATSEEQLRLIAGVLRSLSGRILDQQNRLKGLIAELQEALVTKTKLAGLQQELDIARRVQQSILPRPLPPDPRMQVHGHMTAAQEIGGDFFDCFEIDEHRLGLVVADVSGKGVPAALFMAITRTLLKATAAFDPSPGPCIARVNDLLSQENEQTLFVTLFYAVLDRRDGQVTFVNAGHPAPFRLTRDGRAAPLTGGGGVALGVMDGFRFTAAQVRLEPGEGLFLFTDGVTEAADSQGELFGGDRLAVILEKAALQSPQAQCEAVEKAVREFEGGVLRTDDLTCFAIRLVR